MQNIKQYNGEVFYVQDRLVKINKADMKFFENIAQNNKRKRSRICMHNDPSHTLHEMMIVLYENNYVQPHKHIGKSESYHIVKGTAELIFFDENGEMTNVVQLGDYASGKNFFYRIDKDNYHTIIVTSDIFVFHETTKGPFIADNRTDTQFALWAPKDSETERVKVYVEELMTKKDAILADQKD